MGNVIGAIIGGGKSPKASSQPAQDTTEAQRKAKDSRAALFATEGGVAGQELNPGQVSRRQTLFGN